MKKFFQRSNRLYCLTNICICLLCSSYLYGGYSEVNNDVQQELTGTAVENDLDPLSKQNKIQNEQVEEKKEQVVENKVVTNNQKNNTTNKKTNTTTKKVVTSTKTTTSSKKYVKPNYDAVTGSNVVDYAKKYIGLRYVSGGNSLTKGTDCSGFTKLIYKEFGITLSRSVKAQAKNGTYVQKSDLQKGDLIFYGKKKGVVSHVAIYIGNGKVIHQSTPKSGVKINSMNMMVYITARRVITKPATTSPIKKEEIVKEESNINNNSDNIVNENNNNNVTNNDISNNTNINNSVNANENNVNTNVDINNNSSNNNVNANESNNSNVNVDVTNNSVVESNSNNNVNDNNTNENKNVYTNGEFVNK